MTSPAEWSTIQVDLTTFKTLQHQDNAMLGCHALSPLSCVRCPSRQIVHAWSLQQGFANVDHQARFCAPHKEDHHKTHTHQRIPAQDRGKRDRRTQRKPSRTTAKQCQKALLQHFPIVLWQGPWSSHSQRSFGWGTRPPSANQWPERLAASTRWRKGGGKGPQRRNETRGNGECFAKRALGRRSSRRLAGLCWARSSSSKSSSR